MDSKNVFLANSVFLTLFLSGCASELSTKNIGARVEPETVSSENKIPVKMAVSVGEVMLTSATQQFIVFKTVAESRVSVSHKLKTFDFRLPATSYLLESKSKLGSYYKVNNKLQGVNGTPDGFGGLFVPHEETVATDVYWNWKNGYRDVYQAKLKNPIQGVIEREKIILRDELNTTPTATITYAGVANGQIKFVYKEFTPSGLARAAFTQEVSLDYKEGRKYAYKNAKFIVESADSTQINFQILEPL